MPIRSEKPNSIQSSEGGPSSSDHSQNLQIADRFLQEYSSDNAVRKYSRSTAGAGIEYLLENDYGAIYKSVFNRYVPEAVKKTGLNLLEFGCGAGMNLIYLVTLLDKMGIRVGHAVGTDFSETLIATANLEAESYLPPDLRSKVKFCVARNESLIDDLHGQLGIGKEELRGSFHLVIGVNTIRYSHRLGNVRECVQDIYCLLSGGCACVVIDMNKGFPFFRSRVRDRLNKSAEERYLPSLDEYASPFVDAGFEVVRKSHFSWVPHSASPRLLKVIRAFTPVLDKVAPTHAMRCLVVSRKPALSVL